MNKILDFLGTIVGHAVSGFLVGAVASIAQAMALSPDLQQSLLFMFIGGAIGFLKGIIGALEEKVPKITASKDKKALRSFLGL